MECPFDACEDGHVDEPPRIFLPPHELQVPININERIAYGVGAPLRIKLLSY